MEPIAFSGSATAAQDQLRRVIRDQPRSTIVMDRPGYLAVEFRSAVFRFVDDAEFVIDALSRTIRFRSGARVGYSDMGVNRARMEAIAKAFSDRD